MKPRRSLIFPLIGVLPLIGFAFSCRQPDRIEVLMGRLDRELISDGEFLELTRLVVASPKGYRLLLDGLSSPDEDHRWSCVAVATEASKSDSRFLSIPIVALLSSETVEASRAINFFKEQKKPLGKALLLHCANEMKGWKSYRCTKALEAMK